jgi:hypothetical protein
MNVRNLKERGSRYQDLFYGKLQDPKNSSEAAPRSELKEADRDILDLIKHLRINNPQSRYSLNEKLINSSSQLQKPSKEQQYISIYINEIRKRKNNDDFSLFQESSKSSIFWTDDGLRKWLYDWLIKIAVKLNIDFKIYFRAVMISDRYLIIELDLLYKCHGKCLEKFEYYLKIIAVMSLFTACKCDRPIQIPVVEFSKFVDGQTHNIVEKTDDILNFEADMFVKLDFSLTFNTYIDLVEDEMVKNYFSSDDFKIIRKICEFVLLWTVVVDSDFLVISPRLFCVAILVHAISIVYDFHKEITETLELEYDKKFCKKQRFQHIEKIRKCSGFPSSVVGSVESLISNRLRDNLCDDSNQQLENLREAITFHHQFSNTF